MSASVALALILAVQAVPSDLDIADAKCVGAMTMLSGKAAAADKPGLDSAMMFFLGKIVGRSGTAATGPALKAAVEAILAGGGEAALGAIAEQCAGEVEKATSAM